MGLRAPPPPRRTDADRKSRRDHKNGSWGGLMGDVPSIVIEALYRARPGLMELEAPVVQGLARVLTISGSRARRHAEHDGWFSLNSIELEGRFGRGRFNRLNDCFQLFEVNAEF